MGEDTLELRRIPSPKRISYTGPIVIGGLVAVFLVLGWGAIDTHDRRLAQDEEQEIAAGKRMPTGEPIVTARNGCKYFLVNLGSSRQYLPHVEENMKLPHGQYC